MTLFIPIHYVQVAAPQLHPIWKRKPERDAWDCFKCLLFLALCPCSFKHIWEQMNKNKTNTSKLCWENPPLCVLAPSPKHKTMWILTSNLKTPEVQPPYVFLVLHLQTFILPLFEGAHSTLSFWESHVPAFRILLHKRKTTTKSRPQMWSRAFVMKNKNNLIVFHNILCSTVIFTSHLPSTVMGSLWEIFI